MKISHIFHPEPAAGRTRRIPVGRIEELLSKSGCPGDLDGDTDLADLGILLADFGCMP